MDLVIDIRVKYGYPFHPTSVGSEEKMQLLEGYRIPVYRHVFRNGFTLLTADTGSKFSLVRIEVRTGGFYDREHPGASHFLEHLLFEGPARGGVHPRAQQWYDRGVRIGASTCLWSTAYFGECRLNDVVEFARSLAEIVLQPEFGPTQVDKEKSVIQEEARREAQRGDRIRYRWMGSTLFPDTMLSVPNIGTEESISSMSLAVLQELHRQRYIPANMVLVVAGGVPSHAELMKLCEQLFGGGGDRQPASAPDLIPVVGHREHKTHPKFSGCATFVWVDPEDRKLSHDVWRMGQVLSSFPSGLLYQNLRFRRNLVYQLGFKQSAKFLTPIFQLRVDAPATCFGDVEESVLRVLSKARDGAGMEGLDSFIAREQFSMDRADEQVERGASLSQWADILGERWINQDYEHLDLDERLRSLTPQDIQTAAEYIITQPYSLFLSHAKP